MAAHDDAALNMGATDKTWADMEALGLQPELAKACAAERPANEDEPARVGDGMGWRDGPTECQTDLLTVTLGLPTTGAAVLLHALNGAGKTGAFLLAAMSHALKRKSAAGGRLQQVLIVEGVNALVEQVGYDASILARGCGLTCVTYDDKSKHQDALKANVVVAGNERIKKLCMDASRNSDVAALVLDECDCTIDDATEAGLTELVRRQPLSKPLLLLVTATLQLLRTKEGADLPKGTVAKRMLSAVGGPKGANAHKLGADAAGFYVAPRDPELFSVGLLVAKFGAATNEAALPLKIPWLADLLLKRGENSRTIVFAETNALVTKMKTELEAACAARHGGACPLKFVEVAKNPEKRASNEEKKKLKIALGQLRSKAAHVLVVTAGFARGVDVKGLDLVVLSDLTMKGGVPETST